MSLPKIQIISQQALLKEQVTDENGKTKWIYTVIKYQPFVLILSSSFNMKKTSFTASLVYDNEDLECLKKSDEGQEPILQIVEGILPPIEYQLHFDLEGKKATFEVKVDALSSRHQNKLFRIVLTASDPQVGLTNEKLISHPFKVISKKPTAKSYVKKADRIKKEEETQNTSISPASLSSLFLVQPFHSSSQISNEELNHSLSTLMTFYNQIPTEERPTKIRRVIDQFSEESKQSIQQMCNQFLSVLNSSSNRSNNNNSNSSTNNNLHSNHNFPPSSSTSQSTSPYSPSASSMISPSSPSTSSPAVTLLMESNLENYNF